MTVHAVFSARMKDIKMMNQLLEECQKTFYEIKRKFKVKSVLNTHSSSIQCSQFIALQKINWS